MTRVRVKVELVGYYDVELTEEGYPGCATGADAARMDNDSFTNGSIDVTDLVDWLDDYTVAFGAA